MKLKPFELETDLRAWVRAQESPKFRWVEPARGATLGTPDCWCLLAHGLGAFGAPLIRTVWVELKLGEFQEGPDLLRMHVRPEQKRTITEINEEGGQAHILVGQKGGTRLWLLHGDLARHEGVIDLNYVIRNDMCWPLDSGPKALGLGLRGLIKV